MNKIYAKAFQKSHEILILANCDYNIIEANEAAIKLFGYDEGEIKKLKLSDLFYHEEEGLQFMSEICKEDHVINWEYALKTKENKSIFAAVNGNIIDKETSTYLLVAQNTTEIKKENQAIIDQNQLLATRNMTHLFVHEMKNLSNNISLATHELKDKMAKKGGLFLELVDYVQENNKKIGGLIQSLLTIDKGIALKLENLDSNEVIKEAIAANRDKLRLMNIELSLDLMHEPFIYPIDKEKLLMVFNNIIGNAIDSISGKNGVISISSKIANKKSVVRISDNGSGISREDTENLFKPYYTTKEKGNGLGLSTTKQILFGHKVGFHIESEKNHGSTFTFYFDKKNAEL